MGLWRSTSPGLGLYEITSSGFKGTLKPLEWMGLWILLPNFIQSCIVFFIMDPPEISFWEKVQPLKTTKIQPINRSTHNDPKTMHNHMTTYPAPNFWSEDTPCPSRARSRAQCGHSQTSLHGLPGFSPFCPQGMRPHNCLLLILPHSLEASNLALRDHVIVEAAVCNFILSCVFSRKVGR